MAKKKDVKTETFESTIKISHNLQPYKCPICYGNGIVPDGFYNQTSGQWTSTGVTEKCRSCNCTGIVWG